ncbi:4Fe-4S dicluster domain-containing protein [Chloroflexota bacterium]
MAKVLVIDYEKCTGCRICEQVCSVQHEGVSNPARSRIKIVKWEPEGRYIPMGCQQCESAPCKAICPVQAISWDETLSRVMVDYDSCIGCRICIAICPFGGMILDTLARKVIKCDLCDGDPLCAKFCDAGAIRYVDASEQSLMKQIAAADKFSVILRKVAASIASV